MSTRARSGCVAVIGLALAGCAGHGEPAAAPEWAGSGSAMRTQTVTSERLMPGLFGGALPSTASYEYGDGERVTITTARRGEGAFTVTERVGETVYSVSEVEVTEVGVVLTRITSRERQTITEFRPAMMLVPHRAEEGFTAEQKLMMIVRPMDDPRKIKNRGTATYTLVYSGVTSVSLPGGPMDGAGFVERLDASFTGASVQNITRKWYGVGPSADGLIARQGEESISVLGLAAEKTVREIRRAAGE